MNTKLKVGICLLGAWMLLFVVVLGEAPRAIRWMPFCGVLIFAYIVWASVKVWQETKRDERDRRDREEATRTADADAASKTTGTKKK